MVASAASPAGSATGAASQPIKAIDKVAMHTNDKNFFNMRELL
jgi:hypothetical protein